MEERSLWPLAAIVGLLVAPRCFEAVYDAFELGRAAVKDAGTAHTPDRLIKPGSRVLDRPGLAVPTLCLAAVCMVGWCASIYLFINHSINAWQAWALSSVSAFVAFTPLHDSVHGSVAPKHRWLNDLVGNACCAPLILPRVFFQHMHLLHHRNTNDDSAGEHGFSVDPDHWGNEGPVILLPLRWAVILLWYCYWGKKDYAARKEAALREGDTAALRKLQELRDTSIAFWAVVVVSMVAMWLCRDTTPVVCWILPAMTASSYLNYIFGYIPHRAAEQPRAVPHKENPYLSTSVTRGLFGTIIELDLPMLSQNLHNIHHLFPQVPFYRYRAVWNENEKILKEKGTRVLPLLLWDPRKTDCKKI